MNFEDDVRSKRATQKQIQEKKQKHAETLTSIQSVKDAVLEAAKQIIENSRDYGDSVTVKNFPQQLATSADIKTLLEAIQMKETSVKVTTKNGTEELKAALQAIQRVVEQMNDKDDSDLLNAIGSVEEELKDKEVTVANLDDLGDFFFSLEQAINDKQLSVDLSPLNDIAVALQAVSSLSFDIPDGLMDGTEKELKKANKTLTQILARPQISGGGGIHSSTSANAEGLLLAQTQEKPYAVYIATNSGDANVSYIGKAEVGSSAADSVWQIRKVDENSGTIITYAGGSADFNNTWDNRESLSYS